MSSRRGWYLLSPTRLPRLPKPWTCRKAAECSEGIGDDRYENHVRRFKDHNSLLDDFAQREFKMGAHKAFLLARVAASHERILHTALSDADVVKCLLQKADAQVTLDRWIQEQPDASVAILTHANSTFFYSA